VKIDFDECLDVDADLSSGLELELEIKHACKISRELSWGSVSLDK